MHYRPDNRDTVHEETGVPYPDPGAPLPCVVADEHRLLLSYYASFVIRDAASRLPTLVNESSAGDIALIDFERPMCYYSVPLSDETLLAHPLAYHGLKSYGVFRVDDSAWIRQLVATEYVHPRPTPWIFDNCKHYIFTFHDSLFEAIADGFAVRHLHGSMYEAQDEMVQLMRIRRRKLSS
jgi:hypothetical protein